MGEIRCVSVGPDSQNARDREEALRPPEAFVSAAGSDATQRASSSQQGEVVGGQRTDRACSQTQGFKTSHIIIIATTCRVPTVCRHHPDASACITSLEGR